MTGLLIFVGVLFVFTIGAVALSARFRRFDPVVTFEEEPSVYPNAQTTLLPTPEEVTREALSDRQHYDAEDDLLDPHHSPAAPSEDDPSP